MVDISTSAGTFHIADCLDRAIVRHAERQADLTAFVLRATGLFESLSDAQLPEAFLLELAAVIELQVWEQQGSAGIWIPVCQRPRKQHFSYRVGR